MVYRRARVAAPNSRGEDDVVDGDAAGTREMAGSADGRGNEKRRNRKNFKAIRRQVPCVCRSVARSCRSTPRLDAVGEPGHGSARARAVVSGCATVESRWRSRVVTTRASRGDRSGRRPARATPTGGPRSRDDRAEEDLSRRRSFEGSWSMIRAPSRMDAGKKSRRRNRGMADVQDELDEEPHEPHDDEPHTGTRGDLAELLAIGLGALSDETVWSPWRSPSPA